MLIDSHVNLHAPQFDPDQAGVIERAAEAGVGAMVEICDRIENFPAVHALALGHANIWATVGVHPHEAKDNPRLDVESLCDLAQAAKVVGIGETGLDFHYDLSPKVVQAAVFRTHIEAARRTGLPLIVHSREADAVMAQILEEEYRASPFSILMHCYTSGPELAARAAALGAWFSVSGIATFKAAGKVRSVIEQMPGDRILIETDCPYLAPAPMRGRRNEPAFLPYIAATLGEIRGWSLADTQARTVDATLGLFTRMSRP